MLKNVLKTLVQYKLILIIGGFLVVVIVAVLIFTAYAANVKADVKIQVKPTLSLGPCFNNQVGPKTSIVSPTDGTKYTTGDKVSLTGIAVLECDNSKIDDSNLSWYLDSDTTPFATGLAVSIDSIKSGNHTIKLDAVSGKLKTEVAVNISAADKPKVLGIKAPPPAPPAAPNHAPTGSISTPKDMDPNSPTDAIQEVDGNQRPTGRYYIAMRFVGSASDPDGDSLTYKWTDSLLGDLGTGATLSYTYYFTTFISRGSPEQHVVTLTVTDPKGATATAQVVLYFSCTGPG